MQLRILILAICFSSFIANANIGIFLNKENVKLYNQHSTVIIAYSKTQTTVTIAPEFIGDAQNFAYIIPVPIETINQQIKKVPHTIVDNLVSYTSPRIAKYRNFDPCNISSLEKINLESNATYTTISDDYAIGISPINLETFSNYNIDIFSPKESKGLNLILRKKGYILPKNFDQYIEHYTTKNYKFIIIEATGYKNYSNHLEPIQISFPSRQIELPLFDNSMTNPNHSLNLIFLSEHGEIIPENIQFKYLPTDIVVDLNVLNNTNKFLMNLLNKNTLQELTMTYSWPMLSCKPCVSPLPTIEQLKELGVSWYKLPVQGRYGLVAPFSAIYVTSYYFNGQLNNNIIFQETINKNNFQALYKVYQPIDSDLSKCGSNFDELLLESQSEFSKNTDAIS